MKRIVYLLLLLCPPLLSFAQTDSVWVEGCVTDAATNQAVSMCEVQLLLDGDVKALAFCDEEGNYTIGWVPVGNYMLSVLSKSKSLYYTELQITESVRYNITLMPETKELHSLKTVKVYKPVRRVGSLLISHYDDPRLWNLNGNPELSLSGPASKDLSGAPADVFATSLSTWRPAWLDAPFPKQAKSVADSSAQNKATKQPAKKRARKGHKQKE